MNENSGGEKPPAHDTGQVPSVDNMLTDNLADNTEKSKSENLNNTRNEIDFSNKYRNHDQGPFYVYVEHQDKNIGRLFPIRVGHYLYINETYKKAIVDIKTVGKNRVKVVLNSRKAANDLVNHDLLTKNNLVAYIPRYYTERKGVVKMVDTFFDEDYLLQAIESDREVTSVKRLYRRTFDEKGEAKYVPRQMITVNFLGTTLPNEIKINGVVFQVESYRYPVVMCNLCLRYGHVKSQCRSTKVRCRQCGKFDHESSECESESHFCVYCKTEDHATTSRQCPFFEKQKRIKQLMAERNLSFREAESLEKNPSYAKIVTNNRFNLLQNLDNYPELPSPSTSAVTYKERLPIRQQSFSQPPRRPVSRPNIDYTNSQPIGNTLKRKASTSPPKTSSKRALFPKQRPQPIIPNPYRADFNDFRERLAKQVTDFVSKLISRYTSSDSPQTIDFEQLGIKEHISTLVSEFTTTNGSESEDETY